MSQIPNTMLLVFALLLTSACSETSVTPVNQNTDGDGALTPQSDDAGAALDNGGESSDTPVGNEPENSDQAQVCEGFEIPAPSNLRLVSQGTRTFSLEWDKNDTDIPARYSIQYQVRGAGEESGGRQSTLYNTDTVLLRRSSIVEQLMNGGIVDVTVSASFFNFLPVECNEELLLPESTSLSVTFDSYSDQRESLSGQVLSAAANASLSRNEDGTYLSVEKESGENADTIVQRLDSEFSLLNQISLNDIEHYALGDSILYLLNVSTGANDTDALNVTAYDIPTLDVLWSMDLDGRAGGAGFPIEVFVDGSESFNILYPGLALRVSNDMQVSKADTGNLYTPSNRGHLVFGFNNSTLLVSEPDRQGRGLGVPTEYIVSHLDFNTEHSTVLSIPSASTTYSSTALPGNIVGWAQHLNVAYLLGEEDVDYCVFECNTEITFPLTEPRYHSLMAIDIETGEVLNKSRFDAPVVGSGSGAYINGEIEFYAAGLATRFDADSLMPSDESEFAGVMSYADSSGSFCHHISGRRSFLQSGLSELEKSFCGR